MSSLYTWFEDVDETHKECAQLLAVECVLVLSHIHFYLLTRDFIQQHTYQLQKESEKEIGEGRKWWRKIRSCSNRLQKKFQ